MVCQVCLSTSLLISLSLPLFLTFLRHLSLNFPHFWLDRFIRTLDCNLMVYPMYVLTRLKASVCNTVSHRRRWLNINKIYFMPRKQMIVSHVRCITENFSLSLFIYLCLFVNLSIHKPVSFIQHPETLDQCLWFALFDLHLRVTFEYWLKLMRVYFCFVRVKNEPEKTHKRVLYTFSLIYNILRQIDRQLERQANWMSE